MELTLFDSWVMWLQGTSLKDGSLWGITFIWWARVGLILQYIGALAVIVDIVGSRRLKSFGKKLKYLYNSEFENIGVSFNYSYKWAILFWESINEKDKIKKKELETEINNKPLSIATFLTSIASGFYIISINWDENWIGSIFIGLVVIGMAMWVIPFLLIVSAVLLSTVGAFIDIAFIHPIAWLLDRSIIEKKIKLFGILLISIGFHFDLLTT